MSASFYVFSESREASTIRLRQALHTVPLEAETWLAGRLELRLGPPELRNYPPAPTVLTGIKTTRNTDLTVPIFGMMLAVCTIVILSMTYALISQHRSVTETIADTPTLYSPAGPLGAVQEASATVASRSTPIASETVTVSPSPIPTVRLALAVPTEVPTLVPMLPTNTASPIPTATNRIVYIYPTVTNTITIVPPTATNTVEPSMTPWWPDLNTPPTPVRGIITPAPAGVAGNDYSPAITGRSSTIKGIPTP